jgi:deoxyribose-phosphate aldolase
MEPLAGDRAKLAARIDHAALRPEATIREVRAACELAARCRVGCLCVRPCDVREAREALEGSSVALGSVVGFPHGAHATAVKVAEARRAIADGADELDMVINIGRLRSGEAGYVGREIAAVVEAAGGRIVKVILECCYLDGEQKAAGCRAARQAGAHFVKTSTGCGPGGATVEDVRYLRRHVGASMGVKAAGGIRTLADALAMVEAGADRIGTSSTETILAELPA